MNISRSKAGWILAVVLLCFVCWREVPRLVRSYFIKDLLATKDSAQEVVAINRLSRMFPVDSISPLSPGVYFPDMLKEHLATGEPMTISLRWQDGYSIDYRLHEVKNIKYFMRE